MNKVFKVIWNEARNAYVVASEIAKNRGNKSCSTKKLLAMLIATGVMTCASFDVLAEAPGSAPTQKSQYVAFYDRSQNWSGGTKKKFGEHYYIYDATNKYWVRQGYRLTVKNDQQITPLCKKGQVADIVYTGGGDKGNILQSVTSTVSASGTVTNMDESLNGITVKAFAGVSHGSGKIAGTEVKGSWEYIIQDSSWEGFVDKGKYDGGYVNLVGGGMPKGFVTTESTDSNKILEWDNNKQTYTYNGNPVDFSNVYVIDGEIGVFTNQDGSDFYKGTVFGKNNEILMTVKADDGKLYSYWAGEVTDPSATMESYSLDQYKEDLDVFLKNEEKLSRDDIKEVTMTTDNNSATIRLLRNGGMEVEGAITVTSGGGTGGSGAANDTFVKISNHQNHAHLK